MKKIFKNITAFLMCIFTFLATSNGFVYAQTSEGKYSKELTELLSMHPDLNKQFEELGDIEIVSESNKYYKVTVNESTIDPNFKITTTDEDYTWEEVSKETFELEKAKTELMNLTRNDSIFPPPAEGEWSDYDNTGYVHVNIFVGRLPIEDNHRFFINQGFNWARRPYMSTTDAMGVRVSPNMILLKDTINCGAYSTSNAISPPVTTDRLKRIVKHDSELGLGAEVQAVSGMDSFSGYFNCQATFNTINADKKYGTVNGYYISTKPGGSLSIGLDGKPSIGLEFLQDKFEIGVNISNK